MKNKRVSYGTATVLRNVTEGGFLMVKPTRGSDADTKAKVIALCGGVEKVVLSSGEYGYVVSTKRGADIAEVRNRLGRVLKGATITAASGHIVYRARRSSARRVIRVTRPGLFAR